ncbi:MAG: serine/threonine-protein kinase, partial [Anaerohalosphaeraceae bacterium]
MAYIEVQHDNTVVAQFPVPDEKAGQECVVHVGKAGQVSIAPGESKSIHGYTIAFRQGTLPEGIFLGSEHEAFSVQPDLPGGVPFPVIEGYQIMHCIGRGAMGSVWKAVQLSTRREVAIKFLSQHCLISSKSRRRFEREVQLAARLSHPHITHIYDSGLYEGRYYYTMEYIEGLHLDQYVVQNRLETKQIIELFIKICMAVDYAHQKRIVHRDLKPANILVSADGQPHILDFGLAMTDYKEDTFVVSVSLDGETAGTMAYMSPEQAGGQNQKIGTASDVYSLGVILYKLLTGCFPRDMDGGYYDILRRIVEEPVVPASRVKDIDSVLDQILTQALAQKPEQRPATSGALGQQLQVWLSGGVVNPCPGVRQPARSGSLPGLLKVFAVVLILAGIGILSYSLWSRSNSYVANSSPDGEAGKSDEYSAGQCLQRIDRLMAQKEYLPAKIALSQFMKTYLHTAAARQYLSRIIQWGETIDSMLFSKVIEDHIHYLFAPFALTSEVWKTASQRIAMIQNRFVRRQQLVVLRVMLEDETLENKFQVEADFPVLVASGGMSFVKVSRYCGLAGEVLILAGEQMPFEEPKQQVSVSIRSLHHYPVKIDIPLASTNPLYYGEILIRRLPDEVKGQLAIQVEAQSQVPFEKGTVYLENGLLTV